MKLSLLTLTALVALATADSSYFRKQAESKFLENQRKVLKLYVGVGADRKTYQDKEHVPFPYNKPELYTKPEVLEDFMKVYERGLLDKRGVFTVFCHKNRKDTFKVFDLFYYAKDVDTFFDIASWAREELNPLQWSYAFTTALFHRQDTRGLYIPPMYEVFPTYFVQSEIMYKAVTAKDQGETYAKFDVNNTGWEWSWHSDMLTGPYKSSPKWVGDDSEIRMSYFREDVGLADFIAKFNVRFATWLSTQQYPDIHFHRRGEIFYGFYRWLKNRYNLERMANGLTPVVPFEIYEPLPGYNSHIMDNFGRSYMVRSDKLIAEQANKDGAWELDVLLSRISEVVDAGLYWEVGTEDKMRMLLGEGVNGLNEFAKLMYGTREFKSRQFYRPVFFEYLQTINEMVTAPNDRDYTNTAMGTFITMPRDPAFYMVLASMDYWFDKFLNNFPSYTQDDLNFPGVTVDNIELDKLYTYFERYDWEMTNGINFEHRSDRVTHKYEASQFRLNHKPFTYKINVMSDKDADVFVRFFLGPKTDVDGRYYNLEQQRQGMILLDTFRAKVKSGSNMLERHSHQFPYYEDHQGYRSYYEKVNKSLDTKEPFYYNELMNCGVPENLLLPRGWKSGKEYAVFAIVTKDEKKYTSDDYFQCHHNLIFDQHSVHYPFDRPIRYGDFIQPNMKFSTVTIYHDNDVAAHTHHSR